MHARITFTHAEELRRVLRDEMTKGVTLLQVTPPEGIEYRSPVRVEIVSPGGAITVDAEVVHVLPGVGVAVSFPADRLDDARALLADTPESPAGPTYHEIVPPGGALSGDTSGHGPPSAAAQSIPRPPESQHGITSTGGAAWARASFAEKVQTALHGTKDDRAAILRDQNKQLHPFVLKSPHVSPEEVTGWAQNAQMSAEFLKLISERKEWFTRPAIALALARNPKTPAEIAVRALDNVPVEALRQMAKGTGVLPHVVQAARKKILPR